nr:uncharacterized protein LOC122273854 [Parasteatoda tepidariorum]
MLVQTACINTLASQDQLLDDDTEMLRSSFKESVLTFKLDDTDEDVEPVKCTIPMYSTNTESLMKEKSKRNYQIMSPEDQVCCIPFMLTLVKRVAINNEYSV